MTARPWRATSGFAPRLGARGPSTAPRRASTSIASWASPVHPGVDEDLAALKAFYAAHEIAAFRSPLARYGAGEHRDDDRGRRIRRVRVPPKWVCDAPPEKARATAKALRRCASSGRAGRCGPDGRCPGRIRRPPHSVLLASTLVGRPRWRHYVARDGGILSPQLRITCMRIRAARAAGTALPRGRGAQRADRVAWMTRARSDAIPSPQRHHRIRREPNPSSHNMERAGFRVAHRRPSCVSGPGGA
jgi:hypothetical protein